MKWNYKQIPTFLFYSRFNVFFHSLLIIGCMIFIVIGSCSRSASFAERLTIGKVLDRSNQSISKDNDVKEINHILSTVYHAIEIKDLSVLSDLIDAERGIWVDLKAHKTKNEFVTDIADYNGYVNSYYLNTAAIKARTGEKDQKSLYDVISESQLIKADFFFQGDECEVRFTIEKPESMTDESYRFNNAYFVKDNGKWFLFRLP